MVKCNNDANDNDDDCEDDNLFDEESASESDSSPIPEAKRRRTADAIPAETKEQETEKSASCNDESLHSLISKKKWDCVLERVQQLRTQHEEEERIPELHETEPTLLMTPLYAALIASEHAAPASVIDALVDSHTIQDSHDFLPNPLLSACAIAHSEPAITRILQYHPTLVLEKDDNEMHVLHVVLQTQPTLELVHLLVTTWAREASNMSVGAAWTQLLSTYDGHGVLPIHYAIEYHADTSVILTLVEKYPSSARMTLQADPDISTVHHAAFHSCSFPVLKALLHHYGPLKLGDAGNQRQKKDTPLHLLFHPDVQEQWLTTTTTNKNMSRYKMAWYLIQQYSTTLKHDFGVKKGNKAEQAHKLVFSIQGEAGKSVYDMAAALAEQYPTCEQLALLLRDFDLIILRRGNDWPHLDYNEQGVWMIVGYSSI